jgi:hypothetical protein
VPKFVADSGETTGLKWAAPAAPNYTLLNSGGTELTGAATITISGISDKDQLFVIIEGGSSASASSNFHVRFNSDTGNNYSYMNGIMIAPDSVTNDYAFTSNKIWFGAMSTNAASVISGYFKADGCNSAGVKTTHHATASTAAGGGSAQLNTGGGTYRGTSTISSISFTSDTGNWDGGKVYVYGA